MKKKKKQKQKKTKTENKTKQHYGTSENIVMTTIKHLEPI